MPNAIDDSDSAAVALPKPAVADAAPVSWLAIAIPTILALVVLVVSPNFRRLPRDADRRPPLRTAPLGSDFLQEYVGGSVLATAPPERLYDTDYVQARQHDLELTGFQWPEREYFPMVYPPFYYAAMSLFSGLEYLTAARLWVLLSGLALSISGWLLSRFYPACRSVLGYGLVGAVLYVPLLNNFNMGQKGTWLVLILTITFLWLEHGRPGRAGLSFGLISFKPHLGLVIGLAQLFRGQWRFSLGAVSTVAVLVAGSYLLWPIAWADYLATVGQMGDYVSISGYQLNESHSLWGAAQLTFGWWSPNAAKVIAAVGSLAIIGLLIRVFQNQLRDDRPSRAIRFAALVVGMVLLSPHFYTYDLTILLLAMLLVATSLPKDQWREQRGQRWLVWGMVLFFFLVGMTPQLAAVLRFQPSLLLLIGSLVLLGQPGINPSPRQTEAPPSDSQPGGAGESATAAIR